VSVAELECVKVGDELADWNVKRVDETKLREQYVSNLYSTPVHSYQGWRKT